MFERKDDVAEQIPRLWRNCLRHCKRAFDPFNAVDGLNECRLLYTDRLQTTALIKWA